MTIPGVTPFAGTLPVEAEPASFPARAEALFTWLTADAAPEIDAVATGINAALNDNGTVLDTAGKSIALATNAGTIITTAGTGNAYTITPSVAVAAYENGQTYMLRIDRTSSAAVTLKVGALAAVAVRKVAASGTGFVELAAGDWQLGDVHLVGYNGAQFELLSVPINSFVRVDEAQTITGNWTFAGTTTVTTADINGGTIDGTVIGGNSAAAGTFTRLNVETGDDAAISLQRTSDSNAYEITRISREANRLVFKTRTNADVLVATDYEMTIGASGATEHSFRVQGTERLAVDAFGINTDGVGVGGQGIYVASGAPNIGESSARFAFIYLTNAPNVSSDARLKENIADLTDKERRAAEKIKTRTFNMIEGGQKKIGYIAQEVEAAMASEGLCAIEYGLVTIGEDDMRGVDMDAINAFRLG